MKSKITYLTGIVYEACPYLLSNSPLFQKGAFLVLVENPKSWQKQTEFWLKYKKKKTPTFLLLSPLNSPANLIHNFQILSFLQNNQNSLIFAPPKILFEKFPSPEEQEKKSLSLTCKQKINLPKLIGFLAACGYQKEKRASSPATFAQRGGILDFFPLFAQNPVRLELFGNKIERIINLKDHFSLYKIKIPPLLIRHPQGTILSRIHPQNKIVLSEPQAELKNKLKKYNLIIFQSFVPEGEKVIRFDFETLFLYPDQRGEWQAALKKWQKQEYQIFIATHRLKIPITLPSFCSPLPFSLPNGFTSERKKILVLTHKEIFGPPRPQRREKRYGREVNFLEELKPGMYVVHIDHGIARFGEMIQKRIEGHLREYFLLKYAGHDKLFLPIDQADKITRYIGRANPSLQRLHGGNWYFIKREAQKDALKIARELLVLQAQRQTQKGFAFGPDTLLQQKLEDSFPYTETPDQERAIRTVKQDMEAEKPMDRLVSGDVGFGKTEIAIRAAFKASQDKKQISLLAPTTILAQQHFDTFQTRLKGFPVKIALLSRFQTKAEQRLISKKIQEGKIDIVIGTHRLLSRDVQFRDLGLLIIDEEQRFGVRHKEKLKKFRANLDILTLSATPIPRTLNLALSGLRSLSAIRTPPAGRKSIKTYVKLKNDAIIKKAIEQELARNGQVYYLHNKVETILAQAKKIQKLVPRARIAVAHGKLAEKDLAAVMHEFDQGKIQVLIATTIIENGLDLPRVNTLIVEDAPRFGLSQLYQIRGRIGRGLRQAYAYFLYHQKKLPPEAQKRLITLLSLQDLGSGFNIALRDLEIRGAGNILGREQSGNVNAIGLHLYSELLRQAVYELKTGKKPAPLLEVNIDLPLAASLPSSFIPSEEKRIALYHELSRVHTFGDIIFWQEKIKKQYGEPPREVKNLLEILRIKILARKARIISIDTIKIFDLWGKPKKRIILTFAENPNWEKIGKLLRQNPAWVIGDNKLKIDFQSLGKTWLSELKDSLNELC